MVRALSNDNDMQYNDLVASLKYISNLHRKTWHSVKLLHTILIFISSAVINGSFLAVLSIYSTADAQCGLS